MGYRFKKHYTRDEARSLLPQVRQWLQQLTEAREQLAETDRRMAALLEAGNDVGGKAPGDWVRARVELMRVLLEFHKRQIRIKDPDRGLIDFPAIIHGREAFLCWEKDEDDVEFWHDLDAGYAGRERL